MARILLLDHDVGLRNMLHEVLEHEGYDVVEACNDYEGLAHDQTQPLHVTQQPIWYLVAF